MWSYAEEEFQSGFLENLIGDACLRTRWGQSALGSDTLSGGPEGQKLADKLLWRKSRNCAALGPWHVVVV